MKQATSPIEPVRGLEGVADRARMHRERLERAREALRKHGLAVALLFDPMNVRYVAFPGLSPVCNLHLSMRWVLAPVESKPVIWEYDSSVVNGAPRYWEGDVRAAPDWQFFGAGPNTAQESRAFASEIADVLRERGLQNERLGVDRVEAAAFVALAAAGIELADAQPAIEEARAVKTPDELAILRRNALVADDAIREMLTVLRPGVTENELWGTYMGYALRHGAEWCETRLLSSGPRINPWMQEATHRVVEEGDLVGLDTDLVGEDGYLTDISRTYLCGDAPPSDEQRRLYRVAHDYVYENMPEFRAEASFEELGRRMAARFPEEFHALRYPFIAHGSGMVDEYPVIKFERHHPGELEAGMVLSVEAYVGAVGGRDGVKLEEQIIVTDGEPELISFAPFDERLLS
jgi:Xaa-Pro aminopeptidase